MEGRADLADDSRALAYCLRGASQNDDDIYVMVNAYWESLDFSLRDGAPDERRRVVDTGRESPEDILEHEHEGPPVSPRYTVAPRSVCGAAAAAAAVKPPAEYEGDMR